MKRKLQDFKFEGSHYDRPNQKWVCGHAAEGKACLAGPDARGKCQATFECRPRKDGDRWVCTRPDMAGGPCPAGPSPEGACAVPIPPCVPSPSLRKRRGTTVLLVVALSLAFILVALGWRGNRDFLSPGDLSIRHFRAASSNQCQACHESANGAPIDWMLSSMKGDQALQNNRLCLNCHELGNQPAKVHGLPLGEILPLTQKAEQRLPKPSKPIGLEMAQLLAPPPPGGHDQDIACSTCHREHRGIHNDIMAMSNLQCQTCHAQPFHSFETDHPKFNQYPYRRRTQIQFDHESHFSSHFKDPDFLSKAPTSCYGCHSPDSAGARIQTKGFEETCAACHQDGIRGVNRVGEKGLPMVALPGLDVATLAQHGYSVGDWPSNTSYSDLPITPLMIWMLSADPEIAAALETLHGMDLVDLSSATEDQIRASFRVAWAIKILFYDLATKGDETWNKRAQPLLSHPAYRDQTMKVIQRLPPLTIMVTRTRWFPNLSTEVPKYLSDPKAFTTSPVPKTPPAKPPRPTAPSSTNSVSLLPTTSATSSLLPSSATGAGSASSLLPPSATANTSLLPPPAAASGSLLPPASASTNLSPAPSLLTGPPPPTSTPTSPPTPSPTLKTPEPLTRIGSWYRVDSNYAVYYQPTGHSDQMMYAWYDVMAALSSEFKSPVLANLIQVVDCPADPGLCFSCHSVDRQPDQKIAIQWRVSRPNHLDHPFTIFSHTSHFGVLHLDRNGCIECHVLDAEAPYRQAFAEGRQDPHKFVSNFKPITREDCAACHTEKLAGDSCMQCHRYHIGKFVPSMASPIQPALNPQKSEKR